MIEKLTQEQIKQLPVFRDKWLKIGLCTEPANRKKAEEGIKIAYRIANLSPPEKIVWCTSPLANGSARWSFLIKRIERDFVGYSVHYDMRHRPLGSVWESVRDSVRNSAGHSVRNSVGHCVINSVWESVLDSVDHSVNDSVRGSMRISIWDSSRDSFHNTVMDSVHTAVLDSVRACFMSDSVWDSVRAPLGISLRRAVPASVRISVQDSVRDSVWGQHDAHCLGFFEYFNLICNLTEQTKKLEGLWTIAKNAGWFLPHEKICWVSERHNICKLNNRGVIHCDGGPAIQYPDKFSIWALNGVKVSPEIAETPAQELDCKLLVTERNAEVRREIVRKIGVERICKDLKAKIVDTEKDYELLSLDLGDRIRPYLKMKNPSIGVYHIEGVHPDCKTVKDAIMFRNGLKTFEQPSKLS